MRLSPSQVTFIQSLVAEFRIRTEPHLRVIGRSDDAIRTSVLATLTRDDFVRVVDRASRDAERAARDARHLTSWALRLLPYFDRDPALTVEQAVTAYLADHS